MRKEALIIASVLWIAAAWYVFSEKSKEDSLYQWSLIHIRNIK
jgi:hypothetical protein